jgi:hypothetical protein
VTKQNSQRPDPFLDKLLSKMGCEFEPEDVPVRAENYATLLNCYPNVNEKVKRDSGKAHYGWLIHKTKYLYEAERHAVWENEEGELVDVTPYEPAEVEIKFVSDNNWVYSGKRVDNIRVNRTTNLLVDDFILLAEAESQALSYSSHISGNAYSIPELADTVAGHFRKLKLDLLDYINIGGKPYSACYCGLQKTYKSCHGRLLPENIKLILAKLQNRLSNPD